MNKTNLNNGLIVTADEKVPLNHFLFHWIIWLSSEQLKLQLFIYLHSIL